MRTSLLVLVSLAMVGTPGGALLAQSESAFDKIPWDIGPHTGTLGNEATVEVPEGCVFTGTIGARQFMELTENPVQGNERGVVVCFMLDAAGDVEGNWFVVFEFRDDGYISDAKDADLDAGKLLANIKEGTDASNQQRRAKGWSEIFITGWEREPYYDSSTNNLTWAIRMRGEAGDDGLNHSVRLLGRRGVMAADLVVGPGEYQEALPRFNEIISNFHFVPGETYAEWRTGDKVAEYGLTALVAGGAGALVAKTGLLQKLGKLIYVGVLAIIAAVGRAFSAIRERLFGQREVDGVGR